MAKKRTLKPHFGKREQRMAANARLAMQAGNHDYARQLFDAVQASLRIKEIRWLYKMAQRPIARFMKIGKHTLDFLAEYGNA